MELGVPLKASLLAERAAVHRNLHNIDAAIADLEAFLATPGIEEMDRGVATAYFQRAFIEVRGGGDTRGAGQV